MGTQALPCANRPLWAARGRRRSLVGARREACPVVVIVMENHSYGATDPGVKGSTTKYIVGNPDAPYINGSLIPQGTLFTNYLAGAASSLPNYMLMTAGTDGGCTPIECLTDSVPLDNMFHQLGASGISFGSFAQSMRDPCRLAGIGDYEKSHNPEIYFTDIDAASGLPYACPSTDLPAPSTWPDELPAFSLVIPDKCHDMHGGKNCQAGTDLLVTAGDTWLAENVPAFLSRGAIVIVTFDEGAPSDLTGGGGHVLTTMLGPNVGAGVIDASLYTHPSLLAGLEDYYSVSRLGQAANATPLAIPTGPPPPAPTLGGFVPDSGGTSDRGDDLRHEPDERARRALQRNAGIVRRHRRLDHRDHRSGRGDDGAAHRLEPWRGRIERRRVHRDHAAAVPHPARGLEGIRCERIRLVEPTDAGGRSPGRRRGMVGLGNGLPTTRMEPSGAGAGRRDLLSACGAGDHGIGPDRAVHLQRVVRRRAGVERDRGCGHPRRIGLLHQQDRHRDDGELGHDSHDRAIERDRGIGAHGARGRRSDEPDERLHAARRRYPGPKPHCWVLRRDAAGARSANRCGRPEPRGEAAGSDRDVRGPVAPRLRQSCDGPIDATPQLDRLRYGIGNGVTPAALTSRGTPKRSSSAASRL